MRPRLTGWFVIRGNSDIDQPVPEDSEFGATWTTNRRRYRKARTRGNLRIGKSATPKNARIEATRRSIAGKAGDAGQGATRVLHRGRCRRMREPLGKPSTLLKPATPKACEARGNLSGPSPAQPKARSQGATQGLGRRLSRKGARYGATRKRNPG